jgi:hypothetical protein
MEWYLDMCLFILHLNYSPVGGDHVSEPMPTDAYLTPLRLGTFPGHDSGIFESPICIGGILFLGCKFSSFFFLSDG